MFLHDFGSTGSPTQLLQQAIHLNEKIVGFNGGQENPLLPMIYATIRALFTPAFAPRRALLDTED